MNMEYWMDICIAKAKEALDKNEFPVACIIVYKKKLIASSFNDVNSQLDSTRHAELVSIDLFQKHFESRADPNRWLRKIRKSTIYITSEPCVMCAAALRIIGLINVVYGCSNPRFGGC
ncbi:hypothetical protein HZS_3835, partial [Henneguya salminicola]